MFLTYLRRELRRRARQASIIALGLALGIGLVITVTALSSGVKSAQGEVLHSLYGQDTDITVTKEPTATNTRPGGNFSFRGGNRSGSGTKAKAGTTVSIDNLTATGLAALPGSDVTSVGKVSNVAAAAGGLTLTDTKLSFTIPSTSGSSNSTGGFGGGGSGGFRGAGKIPTPITVDGAQVTGTGAALGPLSSAKLSAGRTLGSADANSDVAVVDSTYAKTSKLAVGSTVTLAKTSFKVVGIVSQSAASSPPDVFIPLARAQALGTAQGKSLKGDVNTIYVAANSATAIDSVSADIAKVLPKTTVTNSSSLASELTGSVASASSLANNLGKWLAIAVLIAAFLLASLLTMSAVSRRVREFGTLKALGWTSRRVVGQVVGESIAIGVIGGVAGVALGFLGATLVGHFTGPLTASLAGNTTGSATPGGARSFGGSGFGNGGGFGGQGGGAPGGGGFGNRFTAANHAASTVSVHLSTPVTATAIIAAVVLAILGGLIAGGFGGWRAARLRPAAALARVA